MKVYELIELLEGIDPETKIMDIDYEAKFTEDDEVTNEFEVKGLCYYPSKKEIYLAGRNTPVKGIVNFEDDDLVNKLYKRGIYE